MIAVLFLVLLNLPSTALPQSPSTPTAFKEAQNVDSQVQETLKLAKSCNLSLETVPIRFCTGFILTKTQLQALEKSDLTSCQTAIHAKGYRTLTSFDSSALTRDSWNLFERSTKRAETLHREKLVLFRKSSTRIDCIHEFLHIRQQTPEIPNPLSPAARAKLLSAAQNALENLADEIAVHEKSGDTSFGQSLEPDLKLFIDHLKQQDRLQTTLDELEPHSFIDHMCRSGWKCTEEDLETALANLHRLRDLLPKAKAAAIEKEISAALQKKLARIASSVLQNWTCPPRKPGTPREQRALELKAANPDLATSLTQGSSAEQLFTSGDISRPEFEKRVLTARMLGAIVEFDVCLTSGRTPCDMTSVALDPATAEKIKNSVNECGGKR